MKKLIIPLLLLIVSCGSLKHTPVKEETIVHHVDSIAWHDSTVITNLIKERYVDMVKPLDTLNLETEYAKATAYLDTSFRALRGSIENKDTQIPVKIKWKERIQYRDSIKIKEVPVPVEKLVTKYPKTYWWFMGVTILVAIFIGLKIYLKFKFKI